MFKCTKRFPRILYFHPIKKEKKKNEKGKNMSRFNEPRAFVPNFGLPAHYYRRVCSWSDETSLTHAHCHTERGKNLTKHKKTKKQKNKN